MAVSKAFSANIQLKPVSDMFEVGPDTRQIHDCFKISKEGAYDALWGRESGMNRLNQDPNAKLAPRAGKVISSIVTSASRFVITERIRLNTTPLVSLICRKPVLSNVWWTLKPKISHSGARKHEKAISLWLNSTPGLLLHFSELQVTAGAWARIKKTPLESLLALDIDAHTDQQIDAIAELFDELAKLEVPALGLQFDQAANGIGWRLKLDTQILEIITGKKPEPDTLISLYNLFIAESKHW